MQRLHGLLRGRGRVEAVDLVEVDVGRVEAREGGVDGVEDGGAGEAGAVEVVARVEEVGAGAGDGGGVFADEVWVDISGWRKEWRG